MALKNSPEQSRVRLLLTLWELGIIQTEVRKGEITKKLVKKGEKAGDYKEFLDELVSKDAIAISGSKVTLSTDKLSSLLGNALKNSDFEFDAQIGKGKANALLRLIRSMNTSASSSENGKTAIASYEEFKPVALEIYESLNRDFNYDNLVPIYRIRRELGNQVSRSQFDTWLLEMQSKDVWQLIGGEMPDITSDKADDSIQTALGGVRYYAKRL